MDSGFESNLLSMNQLKRNVKRSLDRAMEKAFSRLSCLRNTVAIVIIGCRNIVETWQFLEIGCCVKLKDRKLNHRAK